MQKTLRLTKALGVTLLTDTPFQRMQVIAIPDEKAVRAMTHRIKRLDDITHAHNQLKLSYQLKLNEKSIMPTQLQAMAGKPLAPNVAVPNTAPNSSQVTRSGQSQVDGKLSWPESWIKRVTHFELPKPDLHMVNMDIAGKLTGAWTQLRLQGSAGLAYAKTLVVNGNANAMPQLRDPAWQRALYLTLMLLLAAGAWQLNKRYKRRRKLVNSH